MPFLDNNKASGVSPQSTFQAGISDVDVSKPGDRQKGVYLPFPSDPEFTWLYYECTVGSMLDSGIVVHNRLPQVNNLPDTLASAILDDNSLARMKDRGVNLMCNDQYQDIVQRMGHARYWFRLWGQALRVCYQVPIPSIKVIGGVPAIPYDRNPQWAFNRIKPGSNYGGFIIWQAVWSLWYTTAVQPKSNEFPAVNPSAAMIGDDVFGKLPKNGVQAPYTQTDDAATSAPLSGGVANNKVIPKGL